MEETAAQSMRVPLHMLSAADPRNIAAKVGTGHNNVFNINKL